VYEKRILEMKEVCEERVKAAKERGQNQIQAACAPLELKLKSLVMEIESIEKAAFSEGQHQKALYEVPCKVNKIVYSYYGMLYCESMMHNRYGRILEILLKKIKD
jgi:hypothetical protein